MSEVFPSVGYQIGLGGLGGFIVGYALKKLSKLILVLVGLGIVVLLYLGTKGIISINYDELLQALTNSLGMAGSAFSWLIGVISLLPFAASFAVGFLLGLKLG